MSRFSCPLFYNSILLFKIQSRIPIICKSSRKLFKPIQAILVQCFILYPLIMWENLQFSEVFRVYRNGTLGLNGLSFPVLSCQLCVLDFFFFCFRWQFFNICQAIQSNKVLVSLEWRMIQLQIYYKLVCNKCKNVSFFRIYLDCAWTSESWQNLGLQKINLF